jgi:hypothetical protein
MKRLLNKFNTELLLSVGFLYTGFTFSTIVNSQHKLEICNLKKEYDLKLQLLKYENSHLKSS